MAEPISVTTLAIGTIGAFGYAVVEGAGNKVGEYVAEKAIETCEKAGKVVSQEFEAGWARDREAGGISSYWGDDSETAPATA